MRLTWLLAGAAALALAALLASGALDGLAFRLLGLQRLLQDNLAIRAASLREGGPGAVAAMVAICAAWGFLHAVGPGHGKAVIAGAAFGSRATARRMVAIAVAGSVAQALVAVALVYGGMALAGATARGLTEGSARWAAAAGNIVLLALGIWLILRGLMSLRHNAASAHHHHGDGCGHDHGPDLTQASGVAGALALVGAMAARPCGGALIVLAIAWRMGVPLAGAAAALAMGLGAAGFTGLIAWGAVRGRGAALATAGAGRLAGRALPALQILTGSIVLSLGALGAAGS